jgi:hypothetical protein
MSVPYNGHTYYFEFSPSGDVISAKLDGEDADWRDFPARVILASMLGTRGTA